MIERPLSQLVAKLLHHESSCASWLAACAQCLKSHETNCVFQLVAHAKCHNKSNEFAFRLIVGFIQKFQSRLKQNLVDLSLSNAFSIAKLNSINTAISCNTFASLVCEPVTSTKQIKRDKSTPTFQLAVASVSNNNASSLDDKPSSTFQLVVASVGWKSNAISNHGPNQHESSCASLLAARAKCLNSHESGCASSKIISIAKPSDEANLVNRIFETSDAFNCRQLIVTFIKPNAIIPLSNSEAEMQQPYDRIIDINPLPLIPFQEAHMITPSLSLKFIVKSL